MGFFFGSTRLKPPFDISGDLDTPVSAFMKLRALNPRFLLESVEGGERLARYSFIGFGDSLELKVGHDGVTIGAETAPLPGSGAELLDMLRRGLARAPRPLPEMSGVPLAGGLVGYASYDVVRFFERLPGRRPTANGCAGACITSRRNRSWYSTT
jgi:anthranilate synthase component 1